MSKDIKELTLDCEKWICGEGSRHQVGKGKVALLNKEGYMCCLGQWCKQLGTSDEDLLGRQEPHELDDAIAFFTLTKEETYSGEEPYRYTEDKPFTIDAMRINDSEETTAREKILQLAILLEKQGVKLTVVNEDKLPHTD